MKGCGGRHYRRQMHDPGHSSALNRTTHSLEVRDVTHDDGGAIEQSAANERIGEAQVRQIEGCGPPRPAASALKHDFLTGSQQVPHDVAADEPCPRHHDSQCILQTLLGTRPTNAIRILDRS